MHAAARGVVEVRAQRGAEALDQLKRRGVLARVGLELEHDPAAYGADAPKPQGSA